MKKFIKWFILLVVLFIPSFSSASDTSLGGGRITLDGNASWEFGKGSSQFWKDTFCIINYDATCNFTATNPLTNENVSINAQYMVGCLTGIQLSSDHGILIKNNSSSRCAAALMFIDTENWRPPYTSQQCQSEYNLIPISSVDQNYCTSNNLCPSTDPMTSLECQTEYNLIPINEVTANYCKLNFDLISPLDCPSGGGSGTGSVIFSNVYVNNVLYPGGADIYLNVNELLATDISYDSSLMYIDVDFSGDPDYIDGVVNINSYRPTSEDFTNIFVGGLVRLFPFIVIALFIAFVRKLIRKIFK